MIHIYILFALIETSEILVINSCNLTHILCFQPIFFCTTKFTYIPNAIKYIILIIIENKEIYYIVITQNKPF